MIRFVDILIALIGITLLSPLLMVLFAACFLDTSSPIFAQNRVGRKKEPFRIYKFRTMSVGTPDLVTHKVPKSAITKFGNLMRKSKLDELPQLYNVLCGDMSLVGPRPGLLDDQDLIEARDELGVFSVRPGITGLAQIGGIDMVDAKRLSKIDSQMITSLNIISYFRILLSTMLRILDWRK